MRRQIMGVVSTAHGAQPRLSLYPAATPTVRKTLARIACTHGRPKRKAKALPIEDLELIVAVLAA